ncbi:MAG: glycosyltransferase family 4 protein [Sphingobacteriales bacterium]|nr:glycosyltransferase family 4 protein [Sphingobacteriales bacterium]MBI3718023.1 glycosyltransferase family 4 protein [Sphingobacteriales bacterium]
MKKRLAIVSTHPIQYNAPLFKLLSKQEWLSIKVFYTWGQSKGKVFDPGFGKDREWDIPLLDGYDYQFVENISGEPGSHHFKGIINPSLISEIEAYNPDGLLVFGWSFQSHLKVIRYFNKRMPVIFRGDSTLLDEPAQFTVRKIVRRFFLRWVYSHVDYVLYAGTANRHYFEQLGLKSHQLLFAPHAIENERFSDEDGVYEQDAFFWRRELGIKDHELVFLFAGKLEPKKDPELLLNTFMKLGLHDARLIFVGDGVLEASLKEKANTDSRIIFLPFQNQSRMPVVYRLGNIFVLPSKGPGETWGLAVNEAMACGRPVLVSDKCGCATDLVKNHHNGFIIRARDENEWKCALQYLGEHRNMAPLLGEASGQLIKNWNFLKQVAVIKDIFINEPAAK